MDSLMNVKFGSQALSFMVSRGVRGGEAQFRFLITRTQKESVFPILPNPSIGMIEIRVNIWEPNIFSIPWPCCHSGVGLGSGKARATVEAWINASTGVPMVVVVGFREGKICHGSMDSCLQGHHKIHTSRGSPLGMLWEDPGSQDRPFLFLPFLTPQVLPP